MLLLHFQGENLHNFSEKYEMMLPTVVTYFHCFVGSNSSLTLWLFLSRRGLLAGEIGKRISGHSAPLCLVARDNTMNEGPRKIKTFLFCYGYMYSKRVLYVAASPLRGPANRVDVYFFIDLARSKRLHGHKKKKQERCLRHDDLLLVAI